MKVVVIGSGLSGLTTAALKAAQVNPENYRNIIVKVGGYSAYFTDLGREIQDEIISRTEHTMIWIIIFL